MFLIFFSFLKAISISNGLEEFLKLSNKRLDEVVIMVRGELPKMTRITIEALIVIDVHGNLRISFRFKIQFNKSCSQLEIARDVVESLNKLQICNSNDFNWISQLRYYWEEERIMVKMVTTTVPYAYEYLGNSSRLVITPLTDRCYRTLMSAIQLNLG